MWRPSEGPTWRDRARHLAARASTWLAVDLWRRDLDAFAGGRRPLMHALRIGVTVLRALREDRVRLRASALTYLTLLSIVPLLAVVFSVFRGAGGLESLGARLEPFILENLAVDRRGVVAGYLQQFVGNVSAGAVGAVGATVLIYTSISLLVHIERAFNDIWGIREHRRLAQQFLVYWALVSLGPILVGASLALTASFQSHDVVLRIVAWVPWGRVWLGLVPMVLTLVTFSALYIVVPNTRVSLAAGVAGGVVGGTAWETAKYLYTFYTARAFTYDALYGSLSAVPLFIIWLHVTWLIVLFGAEVACAWDDVRAGRAGVAEDVRSPRARALLALETLVAVATAFLRGDPPPDRHEIARRLSLPCAPVDGALAVLAAADLVRAVEVGDAGARAGAVGFVPARPPRDIPVVAVFDAVECDAGAPAGLARAHLPPVARAMERWLADRETSLGGVDVASLCGVSEEVADEAPASPEARAVRAVSR